MGVQRRRPVSVQRPVDDRERLGDELVAARVVVGGVRAARPRPAGARANGPGRITVTRVTGTSSGRRRIGLSRPPPAPAAPAQPDREPVDAADDQDVLGLALGGPDQVAAVVGPEAAGEVELDEREEVSGYAPRGYSPTWALDARLPLARACPSSTAASTSTGEVGTSGLSISAMRPIRRSHWSGFRICGELPVGIRAGAGQRRVADVDVVVVVGHREGRAAHVHQRDHLVGHHRRPGAASTSRTSASVSEPGPWLPRIGWPLISAMSTAPPVECWLTLPEVVRTEWPHLSEVIVRPEAALGQVLEHRQDAAVDLAGLDVLAAALVDLEARVGEHAALELLLRHQQDLADGRAGALERVLAGGAVDRRRLEQLPAVEDRLRVDLRGAAAGGLDREVEVRAESRRSSPTRPSTVPATTFEPSRSGRISIVSRSNFEHAAEVGLEALVAGEALGEQLVELAGEVGAADVRRALGKRVEALAQVLGVDRRGRLGGLLAASTCSRLEPSEASRRSLAGSSGFASSSRRDELEVLGGQLLLLRHRVDLGDAAELGVGEAVAVGVLEDDVVAELLRAAPTFLMTPSLTATTGAPSRE